MPEYSLIDFVERGWLLHCTRCRFGDVLAGPVGKAVAAEQFTEDGWELREGPRLLCPTCIEEIG